ncbi:hypothetical protein NXW71_07105 [Parabacteroides merdae]|nr:hypothetical protein [Parabacteroides merdae]
MMKEQDFIAHVRVEEDAFRIQTVKEHSVGTATLSESFASVFGAAAWGKQNGWWHDMGKYTKNSFQPYIRNASGMAVEQKVVDKPDHSSAGAILGERKIAGLLSSIGLLYSRTSFGIAGLDFFRGGQFE